MKTVGKIVMLVMLICGMVITPVGKTGSAPIANAQLSSSLISGLSQGLGQCAAQIGTTIIGSSVASQVGGRLLSVADISSVPVSDGAQQAQQITNQTIDTGVNGCVDGIAYTLAREVLNQLADDTLAWVESGFSAFGQPGNRAFIGDYDQFLNNVGEQTLNRFLEDVELGGSLSSFSNVCGAFNQDVLFAVTSDYFAENTEGAGVQINPESDTFNGAVGSLADTACDIEEQLGEGSLDSFLDGNFREGGWDAFTYTLQNPNANPVGAYINQREELQSRISQAQETDLEELRANNGWLNAVACPEGNLNPNTNQCGEGESATEPVITTPGTAVNDLINQTIGSNQRQLELADEVNEIVGALADQLITGIISGGGGGGNGNTDYGLFGQATREDSNTLANRGDYATGDGYQGGFQGDFAVSSLEQQIELEENILSYINGGDIVDDGEVEETIDPGLPSTNQIARLRERANQCIAGNGTQSLGPGEQSQLQENISTLSGVEQSVYPPPTGETRQSQSQENEEAGPQKVNWVGNPLNWERGVKYGQTRCLLNERSEDLDQAIDQLGLGNVWFQVNEEGGWEAFMCHGILTTGTQNTADVFGREVSITDDIYIPLGFIDLDEGAFSDISYPYTNQLIIGDREAYKSTNSNQIKIDWNGADYDWSYYNIFADESLRLPEVVTYNSDGETTDVSQSDYNMNHLPSEDANRYGIRNCNEGNIGRVSYIVKPEEENWTEQTCRRNRYGSEDGVDQYLYYFEDAGLAGSAYRDPNESTASYNNYAEQIQNLIGDDDYDERTITYDPTPNDDIDNTISTTTTQFDAPGVAVDGDGGVDEEDEFNDDLRELLNDLNVYRSLTPELAQSPDLDIAQIQETLNQRYGRLQNRFHSDADLQAAADAYEQLNPNDPTSLYSQMLSVVNENQCNVPQGWQPPVDEPSNSGGGDDGEGGGRNDGGSDIDLQIDQFIASRIEGGASFIQVNWSSNAQSCAAETTGDRLSLNQWSGPVGPSGSRTIEESGAVELSLECTRENQTQSRTQIVPGQDSGPGLF